jgi:hypothetical protein
MEKPVGKTNLQRLMAWSVWVGAMMLVLAMAGEITVRLMGVKPWNPTAKHFHIAPDVPLFLPDVLLGFRMNPGHYRLSLNDSLSFEATIGSDGYRPTQKEPPVPKPEVWILGCSFSFGWMVGDSASYPWLLQKAFPEYTIRNLAVPAYGTLQSVRLLEDELEKGNKPGVLILAYGSFHDQRNTVNRYWKKALSGEEVAPKFEIPFARLMGDDSIETGHISSRYNAWPAQSLFGLSHFLEQAWNRREDHRLRSADVSAILIRRIKDLCKTNGIRFILAGIYQDPQTRDMLARFSTSGIETVDISVDLTHSEFSFYPADSHPNEKAHRAFAASLSKQLRNSLTFSNEKHFDEKGNRKGVH